MGFIGNALGSIGSGAQSVATAGLSPIAGTAGSVVNSVVDPLVSPLGHTAQNGNGLQANQLATPVNAGMVGAAGQQMQGGLDQQQALIAQLQAQNGIANQSNVYNQLQGVANGTGPNPAQAMLAQSTGSNAAMQAALMAGQRGAGANAGLIARQAGMQGGALQQQAAGQAATLQANQSLGALNQLGGIAGQQVGQQMGAQNQYNQATQNAYGQQLGQLNAQNQNQLALNSQNLGFQSTVNNNNSQRDIAQGDQRAKLVGGLLSGAGSAVGAAAKGGPIEDAPKVANLKENYAVKGPRSRVGQHLMKAKGGPIQNMQSGGHVPGTPVVGGAKDSYSNDIIDARLSPGEIVLPRSVTQSADPVSASAKFVQAIMAKKGKK